MRSLRRGWIAPAVALVLTIAPVRQMAYGQPAATPQSAIAWTVTSDAFTDLWFHCLAVIGYEGYGPLALYDQAYAARIRAEKRRAGITSRLDVNSAELRAVFERDSAFEVLHFVPLYFVGREPLVVLRELRNAIDAPATPSAIPARSIAAALPTPGERALFRALIDAASDEWTSFLRDERQTRSQEESRSDRELQRSWDTTFLPALANYLASTGLIGGTIIQSPAIGGDGRFVRDAGGSAIVVVSSRRIIDADSPLLASVRELAFPLLDRLHSPLVRSMTRLGAARARDAAAVRAGALLLDATDRRLAAAYRRHFLALSGARSFDSGYPIDQQTESDLRALITASVRSVAARSSLYENR